MHASCRSRCCPEGYLFRPLRPVGQIDAYIAGLILLAAAPCTAMVFVWSNLVEGEPHFTLSQIALNDTIMVFAFAPIVTLLLCLSSITVLWDALLLAVVLYIVVPVSEFRAHCRPIERTASRNFRANGLPLFCVDAPY
jgi:ACR3 family arsenite efflux pump ArsB